MKRISKLITANMISDFSQKELYCQVCQGCHERVTITEMINPATKQPFQFKKGCKCEDLKLAREAIEIHKQKKKQFLIDQFNQQSLIPKKLLVCSFDNYVPKNSSQQEALTAAVRFVDEFDIDQGKSLIYSGLYGIGKSHLAVSIVKALIGKGYTGIFISVPKLLTRIRGAYNDKEGLSEFQILTILETVDVLVLDDIGAEHGTDWAERKLLELIDHRQGRHTIYTTNMTSIELHQWVADRNFSRVMGDTERVKIDGDDHRLMKWTN